MNNKYEKVLIHVTNKFEKLAALHLLADLAEVSHESISLDDTKKGEGIADFPYVGVGSGRSGGFYESKGRIVIEFCEIGKIDEILAKHVTFEVKLNDSHTAIVSKDTIQVGCQTFKAGIITSLAAAWEKAKNA